MTNACNIIMQQPCVRTWALACPEPECHLGPPAISQRGLCLIYMEFLVRYPTSECVITSSSSLPFLNSVLDLFPKTLFHVFYTAALEDPPRSNVIRHPVVFDKSMAARWRDRGGAPFNVIFTGEGMDSQMALYATACPAAGLLLITEVPEYYYLQGELICPLYCPGNSCLSALVPHGSSAGTYGARAYADGLGRFYAGHRGSTYNRDAETEIVLHYARTVIAYDELTAALLAEVVRAGLPSAEEVLRFST